MQYNVTSLFILDCCTRDVHGKYHVLHIRDLKNCEDI